MENDKMFSAPNQMGLPSAADLDAYSFENRVRVLGCPYCAKRYPLRWNHKTHGFYHVDPDAVTPQRDEPMLAYCTHEPEDIKEDL